MDSRQKLKFVAVRKTIASVFIIWGFLFLGDYFSWWPTMEEIATPLCVDFLFRANYIKLDNTPILKMLIELLIDGWLPKDARPIDIYHVLVMKNGIFYANSFFINISIIAICYVASPIYKHTSNKNKS